MDVDDPSADGLKPCKEERDPCKASPPQGSQSSEQCLASLKSYAQIAWEECRAPLSGNAGLVQVRWEVYSTWTLLLCLWHAEAEAERCRRTWVPQPWHNEAQALRHLFLQNHSVRALTAVLRWLRWSYRWGPLVSGGAADESLTTCLATYERTRRNTQLRGALPGLLQGAPFLHPDGPLQHNERFQAADIEDERQLLSELWRLLRQGNLRGALKLCADSGQAWRTAMLQGMLPLAEASDEAPGYEVTEGTDGFDKLEELLADIKEEHTDWTELGTLDRSCQSSGNPWRRIWKEQCYDTAQRNLQGSSMDKWELAIYGFCAGNYDALMPYCQASWADRCWGELHCLKEWLVERLLEDGQETWCSPGFDCSFSRSGCKVHLGEGDGGICSEVEDSQQSRSDRHNKLCGRLAKHLAPGDADQLSASVRVEIQQLLLRILPPGRGVGGLELGTDWEVPMTVRDRFAELQAILIESTWMPQRGDKALGLLRNWLDCPGGGSEGPPVLVKQFASYFAVWQKELLEVAGTEAANVPLSLTGSLVTDVDVDDIVGQHIRELIAAAAGPAWPEQCLRGEALELVAEHCAVLRPEGRLEAFTTLLLCLGRSCGCGLAARAAVAAEAAGACGDKSAEAEVLKRCLWVFWSRFPDEFFLLLVILVRKVLCLEDSTASEASLPSIGPAGVREKADPEDMLVATLCLLFSWVVVRDKAEEGTTVAEANLGLQELLGQLREDKEADVLQQGSVSIQAFLRLALDTAALPLLTDTLLCLTVKDPESALAILPAVQASALWSDAFSSGADCTKNLNELEWFLVLCHRYTAWATAHSEAQSQLAASAAPKLIHYGSAVRPGPGASLGEIVAKSEKASLDARDALLDWARTRLAQDRPLLQPQSNSQTVLPDTHWESLRKAAACRVLLLLLDCFEGQLDFEGAMQDLVVAVAESPWLLSLLDPRHARLFLSRLALIPTHFPPSWVVPTDAADGR
eukprot:TRINITY_DN42278_c0_g1_i1.p1 TRINITY_DN42278_c0_g1~~TRINITY_DN42278_c0_g1_i1.p1  ORF type:complete len:986 (-),score=182.20 TRINITY_DN42278_c0_g1_i1:80-3004(-)